MWRISYIYNALETKPAKVGTGGSYTYYAGNFVYSGSSLTYIMHREGMYLPGGNYEYYLKDHLGNTRLVVNTVGTGGTVVQQTDYYPFGMDIAVYNGGLDNKYRYNGKEIQDDMINGKSLQWYDYGARFYDAQIGRWHSADPLAENRLWVSPFQYVQNNPITRIDPNGMLDGWVTGKDGNTFWDPNTNNQEEFDTNYTNLGKDGYSYEGQTTELTDDDGNQFFGDDTGNISTLLDEVSLYGERPQKDPSGQLLFIHKSSNNLSLALN